MAENLHPSPQRRSVEEKIIFCLKTDAVKKCENILSQRLFVQFYNSILKKQYLYVYTSL